MQVWGCGWGRETERKATVTDKLAINLNNGVKGHKSLSTLGTIPNLYLCKFCSRLKSYVDFINFQIMFCGLGHQNLISPGICSALKPILPLLPPLGGNGGT